MLHSKAIKMPPEEKRSKLGELCEKLYLWWIETPIADFYYVAIRKCITNPIFQVTRLVQWYINVFRHDYDFDGHSMFAIIEYKLKRIQKALIDGHAIQEDLDMKALKLAIKLAGRQKDDNYYESFYDRHDRKWGKMKSWFIPCKDKPGYSTWHSSRPKANTKKLKEQERKESLANSYAEEAKRKREEKYLYDILHKYLRRWWD